MTIKNVRVVNFDKTIECADIEIKNNKIFKITKTTGKAKYTVVPGFIDQHMHGFTGYDAMDGKEALEKITKALVKHGTTSFLPTLMTEDPKVLLHALEEAAKAESKGSRILGFHVEGPFLDPIKKGAHQEKYLVKATKTYLDQQIKAANGMIRKVTIAPENFPITLLNHLLDNNIIPSLGHSNCSAAKAREYFANGASSATHLWNAMSGVANRQPGLVEESINNENCMAELVADLVHVDEDAIRLTIAAKGTEAITLVTDAIRPAGLNDGESISGGLKIVKKGSLITLKGTNTIAGSAATMYDNFKNLIKMGYDMEDVVAMTSYNQAVTLGEEKLGYIKKGNLADLVILNEDLSIHQIIIDGITIK